MARSIPISACPLDHANRQRVEDRHERGQRQHQEQDDVKAHRHVIDRAAERAGERADALNVLDAIEHSARECFVRPVRDGHVHLTGRGQQIGLERLHHRRQQNAHAKDDQHAKDDGERGEKRAEFAPSQVAGG